jgi:hypothetical protein
MDEGAKVALELKEKLGRLPSYEEWRKAMMDKNVYSVYRGKHEQSKSTE